VQVNLGQATKNKTTGELQGGDNSVSLHQYRPGVLLDVTLISDPDEWVRYFRDFGSIYDYKTGLGCSYFVPEGGRYSVACLFVVQRIYS
jgi:hypothetical protein